jgi:hypothetical protein
MQTDHRAATGIGTSGERARYVTHEEQLRALVVHMRRRDRHLARAIMTALSAQPRTLGASVRWWRSSQSSRAATRAAIDASRPTRRVISLYMAQTAR